MRAQTVRFFGVASVRAVLAVAMAGAMASAGACSGRAPIDEPTPKEPPSFTFDALELPARLLPNADVAVSIDASNDGEQTVKKGDVELRFAGDVGFTGTLKLEDDVKGGASGTFSGTLHTPSRTGRGFALGFDLYVEDEEDLVGVAATTVELTCDDGVFCNGAERLAGGTCVAGFAPCDDDAACTADSCDEDTDSCDHTVAEDDCATCSSGCTPDCTDKECGDDGCGGSCGTCDTAGEACAGVLGECVLDNQAGSCGAPLNLIDGGGPAAVGDVVIEGDTSAALSEVVPTCNNTSTAVELVYAFDVVGADLGMDARSYGYDTVLHLRKEDPGTGDNECLNDDPSVTVGCSDDSAPPGDYGSRVAQSLTPGRYYLIVDGFDSTQSGPFTLEVSFGAGGCVPQCDGKFCGGNDGCGGDCGTCDVGFSCNEALRCEADVCTPDCTDKVCGDDGCGGSCGDCDAPALCVPATQQCEVFPSCDHEKPICDGCDTNEFCGTDCHCHPVDEAMPDLVLNAQRLADELLFDTITVDEQSCSVVENCVGGTGDRDLLRFAVEAINQGQATMVVEPPDTRPDQFTYSTCHGHFHFFGFAEYYLKDAAGNVVATGLKQAYCMEDTIQVMEGPNVGCEKIYSCDAQGIQPGWSDLYGNALDCQWLDITGIAPGDYQLEVSLNPGRGFEEITFDNNTATVPVTIPD